MKQAEIELFIKDIGTRIQELRRAQGITQLDLASKADIDVRQVQRLENGQTSATLKTLLKIINGLGVNFLYFFEFTNKKEK
ncbi:MAG: helix-turn-helix domain-containing protein [Lacinutrix venerupis]